MKTVYDKIEKFQVVGVKPGALEYETAFENITDESFAGKWKVIVFYPKDFTFVCPTEIVAYDRLVDKFNKKDAVLMIGSTDNEFCKLAWKNAHSDLKRTNCWMFADTQRSQRTGDFDYSNLGLATQLGVFSGNVGAALRATFIVDPDNVIQHVTVNNLNVGRNPDETLRILTAIQSGELVGCEI